MVSADAHLMKYSSRAKGPRWLKRSNKHDPTQKLYQNMETATQIEEVSYVQLCYDELRLF